MHIGWAAGHSAAEDKPPGGGVRGAEGSWPAGGTTGGGSHHSRRRRKTGTGRGVRTGAGTDRSDATRCALVPPSPNALTPATRGPAGHGRSAVIGKNGEAAKSKRGLGGSQ